METTLGALLSDQARTRPHEPCLTYEDVTYDYAEVERRSTAAAHALASAGVGPGDRVAVLAHNGVEYFDLLFGCGKAGATLVALNWRLAAREIEQILDDASPSLVVVSHDFLPLLGSAAEGPAHVIDIDLDYDAWVGAARPTELPGSEAGGVALQLYTSGTTGLPKGVMLTHESVSYARRLMEDVYEFWAEDTMIVAMPMFHIGGLAHLLGAAMQGAHSVLLRVPHPAEVVAQIERHRVTHGFFVPAVIQNILSVPGIEDADLDSFRLMSYGASPISETLLAQAMSTLGCGFLHAYGLTESTGTMTALRPVEHDAGGPRAHLLRSCGRVVPWAEAAVFDPVTRTPVEVGAVGEIWVRSAANMLGYWNQPEATAEVLVEDGWLRTGDAAYQDDDGYFYIHDRFKDMIISGGENIYPAEVENVLYKHPAVGQVAVIGVPHDKWGETVKAFVVLADGATVTSEELIEFARGHLARFKCPTSTHFVDELPRNASGKIVKTELRRPYREPVGPTG